MRRIHHPTFITTVPLVAGLFAIVAQGCVQKSAEEPVEHAVRKVTPRAARSTNCSGPSREAGTGGQVTSDRLNEAIKALEERSRLVIDRHLAGEPQAVTAKVLGVCEGTITRMRQRAIQRLRELLMEPAADLQRSKPR